MPMNRTSRRKKRKHVMRPTGAALFSRLRYSISRSALNQHPFDAALFSSHCGDALSLSNKGTVRTWESVSAVDNDAVSFSVCTYNILSQRSLEANYYLYESCRRRNLDWKNRETLLRRELASLKADIFCFQELEEGDFPSFARFLQRFDYRGVFKKRTGGKADGCATFWRHQMFALAEWKGVEYVMPGTYVYGDNVGLLVKLRLRRHLFPKSIRPSKDQRTMVVANTHLLFNLRRHDVRLAQLTMLLAHIQRMANVNDQNYHYPVLLCGDFNETPDSSLLSLVKRGELDYKSIGNIRWSSRGPLGSNGSLSSSSSILPPQAGILEQGCLLMDSSDVALEANRMGIIKHQLSLHSAFENNEEHVTTVLRNSSRLVDFIFHGPTVDNGKKHSTLQCIARCSLLTENQVLRSVGFMPNAHCGSDHLPLIARFQFVFGDGASDSSPEKAP